MEFFWESGLYKIKTTDDLSFIDTENSFRKNILKILNKNNSNKFNCHTVSRGTIFDGENIDTKDIAFNCAYLEERKNIPETFPFIVFIGQKESKYDFLEGGHSLVVLGKDKEGFSVFQKNGIEGDFLGGKMDEDYFNTIFPAYNCRYFVPNYSSK